MLRAFGQCVATCYDMLGIENQTSGHARAHKPAGPNEYKCCMKNVTVFKFEPITPSMSQHIATGWPNARNMVRPTMLRYVGLRYCDRLAGA